MPGAGTSPATTKNKPAARCLDITRLIRRAGRPMTGVDRVEFAYLRALVKDNVPLFALARTRLGYVLLDAVGAAKVLAKAQSDDWGPLDVLGRLSRRPEMRLRAEADLRRLARARCLPQRLGAMLRRYLPAGTHYLNTGHSNLTDRVISGMKRAGARIAVLVHDTIPLDFPQYQRSDTLRKFKHFLGRSARNADLVIANSRATLADCQRHMEIFGRIPDGIVAPLGIDVVAPDASMALPEAPYFITVGTIEPRKNHALLLDIWDQFASEGRHAPRLVICGARGWRNEAVLARLDAGNRLVEERAGLTDAEVAALVKGARALLFPSLAEGYGLPPVEAAARGVPVVVSDLGIYRETLGDIPIYAASPDVYLWRKKIEQLTEQRPVPKEFVPPGWDEHFNIVLSRV